MTRRATGLAAAGAALGLLAGCGGTIVGDGEPDAPRTVLQTFDVDDGHLRWTVELGATDGATEPVLIGDTLIVAAPGGSATAYAVADGKVRWSTPAALPAAVRGDLAVFDLEDRVEARRADTGAVVWTRRTLGDVVQARADTGIALIVDPARTAADCSPPPTPGGAASCSALAEPPPQGDDPPPPTKGEVSLLDPATGDDLWHVTLPGRGDLISSAVSTRHVLVTYATDYSANRPVAALRLGDGTTDWTYPAGPVGRVTSADGFPAVLSDLDPAGAEVLDPETGEHLWSAPGDTGPNRLAPFVVADGDTGYRRDPRTGARLPGTVPMTYGVAAHGDLLVGSRAQTLTAVRGGDRIWTAALPAGARPITYLDATSDVVAAVTEVGQEVYRD